MDLQSKHIGDHLQVDVGRLIVDLYDMVLKCRDI